MMFEVVTCPLGPPPPPQEVKDQNVVLSKELEMMQLQSEDDTHQKKGNSLFGEVSLSLVRG